MCHLVHIFLLLIIIPVFLSGKKHERSELLPMMPLTAKEDKAQVQRRARGVLVRAARAASHGCVWKAEAEERGRKKGKRE